MVVRQTWRTKSPNFVCIFYSSPSEKSDGRAIRFVFGPSKKPIWSPKNTSDRPSIPCHSQNQGPAVKRKIFHWWYWLGSAMVSFWADIGMAENFSIQQSEQIVPLALRGGTPFVQLQRSTISRWLRLHHLTLLSPFSCHIWCLFGCFDVWYCKLDINDHFALLVWIFIHQNGPSHAIQHSHGLFSWNHILSVALKTL